MGYIWGAHQAKKIQKIFFKTENHILSPPLPLLLLQRVSKTGNNSLIIISMPGIILSGGAGASTSVDVFVLSTGLSCSLLHSLMWDTDTPWTASSSVVWVWLLYWYHLLVLHLWPVDHQPLTLVERREEHTIWPTDQGLMLMGGYYSRDTSEIVTTAGGQGGDHPLLCSIVLSKY